MPKRLIFLGSFVETAPKTSLKMIRKIRCNHKSGSFPHDILTLATVLGNGGHSKQL